MVITTRSDSGASMRKLLRLVAGVLLGGTALTGAPALAQDTGTVIVGGAEISVGGGFATLGLPDVRFGVLKSDSDDATVHRFFNDNNFEHHRGNCDPVVRTDGARRLRLFLQR